MSAAGKPTGPHLRALEQISTIAHTASGLAAQALEQAESGQRDRCAHLELAEKLHATQTLVQLIGALADAAATGNELGALGSWFCGVRS